MNDHDKKNSTIIVIPHDITLPCYSIIEGVKMNIKDEIDILRIQREARGKRIDSVDKSRSAVTKKSA
jgi:hypothetical protein